MSDVADAPVTVGRVITFRLSKPTLLLNRTRDRHWTVRMKANRAMAWNVRIALGQQRPEAPFTRARVTIARHSVGVPDVDGLIGGLKGVIDCLLPQSKTHPCGLGLVLDDSPAHMVLVAKSVKTKVAEQCTIVTIEELL